MKRFKNVLQWVGRVVGASLLMLAISACEGDRGPAGSSLAVTGASSSSLTITVDSVTVASPPVVKFHVGNQDSNGVKALTTDDLRFTIAKLMPGDLGNPSSWQNYILTTQTASAPGAPGFGDTAVQATRENDGTLVDHGDGSYTYTFATDITNVSCPAPCQDSEGNTLDVSYQPTLTHRLAIQTANGLPAVNAVYTFRPSDGATSGIFSRDIVSNESCNECHNELSAHDERIDTAYCVTCHNPGTTDPDSGNTVDFKVMIHRIHAGEDLPSVHGPDGEYFDDLGTDTIDETADNGEYAIWGYRNTKHDFSSIKFPQGLNQCAKCHNGEDEATPDGDNWKTQVSMQACGSCHEDVDFSKDGSPTGAADPDGHTGGIMTDNSRCTTCHAAGQPAGSVAEKHADPVDVAVTKFKYRILRICGQNVPDPDDPEDTTPWPSCVDANPVVQVVFEVTDPTGATSHRYGNKYDVSGATDADRDPEFAYPATRSLQASLNIVIGWMSGYSAPGVSGIDFTNEGLDSSPLTGNRPSRAGSVSAITTAAVVDNGDGTFTYTFTAAMPGTPTSGVIALEGHPKIAGTSTSIPVKGTVAYFGVGGAAAVERRIAVDVTSKCDNCHNKLALHGTNRSENAQLCVICHNPRGTDVLNRPKDLNGVPDGSAPDGVAEESIDLKVMIHGIHAGAASEHGFRENGLGIWGRQTSIGSFTDFGHIRFPGILNDCTTCHNEGTYELDGIWQSPLQNGVLPVTVRAIPSMGDTSEDQTDDLFTTPTAAVCSACHDGVLARAHMVTIGGAVFEGNLATMNTSVETCSVCHGPGSTADVKVVHGVE